MRLVSELLHKCLYFARMRENTSDARRVAHVVRDHNGRIERLEVEHHHRVQIQPGLWLCNEGEAILNESTDLNKTIVNVKIN